jgi:hypothetical protein
MDAFLHARRLRSAALIGTLLLSLPACSGGGTTRSLFGGAWQGTWQSPGFVLGGAVTLHLTQHGTAVAGTATFEDHPCMTTCNVSWQAMGTNCSGELDAGSFQISFEGSCGGPMDGDLSGHFEIHGGTCDGESGTLTLTRGGQMAGGSDTGARQIGELILIDPKSSDLVRLPIVEPSRR